MGTQAATILSSVALFAASCGSDGVPLLVGCEQLVRLPITDWQ
jgi:hypothetical protein